MIEEQKVLAVVVARGGSKGLPDKNLRKLGTRPLIAHTFLAAKEAKSLDRIILSTDSPDIAKVGRRYGIEVPFLRAAELATDEAPMIGVLVHAVKWIENHQQDRVDIVVLLQATSPLREAHHIEAGLQLLDETGADSVVGLCEVRENPYWMKVIRDGRVERFISGPSQAPFHRRQDLPQVYMVNGALYVTRRSVIMEQNEILGKDVRGLIMSREASVDIDTLDDFLIAEATLKSRGRKSLNRAAIECD